MTYRVIYSPHQHPKKWIVRPKYLHFLTHCSEFLLLFHFTSRRHHVKNNLVALQRVLKTLNHVFTANLLPYLSNPPSSAVLPTSLCTVLLKERDLVLAQLFPVSNFTSGGSNNFLEIRLFLISHLRLESQIVEFLFNNWLFSQR